MEWVSKDWLWLPHETEVSIPAQVARKGDSLVATTINNENFPITEAQAKELKRVHPSALRGIPNMIHLEDMSESVILHTLRHRYGKDEIYTHISSILISINPYKILNIYDSKMMARVRDRDKFRLLPKALPEGEGAEGESETYDHERPHPFKLAADAHKLMVNRGENQSVIISGESGSGKTEATKIILKYLSFLSGEGDKEGGIEQQLLEANPIIEALGNSQTVRNNNSSRFGKWVEIHFDSQLRIIGGSISHYLLEKSRVVQQSPGERNYHMFHQICASRDHKLIEKFNLGEGKDYIYTKEAKSTGIDGVSDRELFTRTLKAMGTLQLTDEDVDNLIACLVAILNLGNITIKAKNGNNDASDVDPQDKYLVLASELLGVKLEALSTSLCTQLKSFGAGGAKEAIRVPFSVEAANAGRDALSKHLYGKMFDWAIKTINKRLKTLKFVFAIIGILDIFGFEIFEVNRFEQFLINFANEKLQQHFNHFVFELEQEEYKAEGLTLPYVEFKDNKEILSMIETPPNGILPMLDEELWVPKGTDETLLAKLHAKQKYRRHYRAPRVAKSIFTIRHYAGDVDYTVDGFLVKNQDKLSDDQLELIKGSSKTYFASLFIPDKDEEAEESKTAGVAPAPKNKFSTPVQKPAPSGPQARGRTLGSQFKKQLASLMAKLESTNPHFIRCIKPNSNKRPDDFDSQLVIKQLRYAGIEAVIRVRQTGFPVRHQYRDFFSRFKMLAPRLFGVASGTIRLTKAERDKLDFKDLSVKILKELKFAETDYGVGKTKMFLTHEKHLGLEAAREACLLKHVIVLQKGYRGKRARVILARLKKAKQRLQDVLNSASKRPLQDLLRESFFSEIKKSLEQAINNELPPKLPVILSVQELSSTLAVKEKTRKALIAIVESKSEEVAVYEKGLADAKAVGDDIESLSEYARVVEALDELKKELERRAEAARKAAEREAKRQKKLAEKAEKEKLKKEKDEKMRQEKEEKDREEEAKRAQEEAERGVAAGEDSDQEGDVEDDNDSVDSLSLSEDEREKQKEKERRERREKERADREERERKEREEREKKEKEEIENRQKTEEKTEKEEKEKKLKWLGLGGMDEFKSLSENALISTLLKKVATLERENMDIRGLYGTMNEELFKKLEDFESYKKRVKNMEDKYVERIQKLQYKVNVMEQLRTTEAKESKDGMTRVYLKRIQELERLQEKNMEDLVQKCDQLLKLEIEHDEQSGAMNNLNHQLQQKDNTIKTLREQVARLEGEMLKSSRSIPSSPLHHSHSQTYLHSTPGHNNGPVPATPTSEQGPSHSSEPQSPPGTPVRETPSPSPYPTPQTPSSEEKSSSYLGMGLQFLGYGKRTATTPGTPSGIPTQTQDKQKVVALERILKEKDDYIKSLERKNQGLNRAINTLKKQLDLET